jgi:hypothetical protein
MTLFENPIQLAKQARDLYAAVCQWQYRLRLGDIDETGPFIGKPPLTERDAFRVIAELSEPVPIKQAWTRWAFRLTEARVNAQLLAAMAQAYRVELHQLEQPEPVETTLWELLHRTLNRPNERLLWVSALSVNTRRLRRVALELPARQNEIARRAGFTSAAELTAPAEDLPGWAERLLLATDDVYRDLIPHEFAPWLDAALAISADRGWPAQLNPRTLQPILGSREWLDGLELPPRAIPAPIAASSFARGLYQLGSAMHAAAMPKQEPFVVANDPYGLYRHTLGCLCAQLTSSTQWQLDVLSLSRPHAAKQARAMLVSQLIYARTSALAVLLWDRSCQSASSANRDFEELSHRALGFAMPLGLCGVIPRLHVDAGQRLVSQWLASRWRRNLIAEFDEDWFRNPRGIEAVRERLSRVLPTSVDKQELSTSLDAFVTDLQEAL